MRVVATVFIAAALVGQSQPTGRYAHCATVFENFMIVYGGKTRAQGTSQVSTLGDTCLRAAAPGLSVFDDQFGELCKKTTEKMHAQRPLL